jgi:hypothetical protein
VATSENGDQMGKHLLLNGVAKSGCLNESSRPLLSTDKTLAMIREKLNTPQAIDVEFAAIPAKRLSAGVSTSQCPYNQVVKHYVN